MWVGVFLLFISAFFYAGSWPFAKRERSIPTLPDSPPVKKDASPPRITRDDLPRLLNPLKLDFLPATGRYPLAEGAPDLTIETSLNMGLQRYVSGLLKRSRTFQAAVVVLRPHDGRILVLADYESEGSTPHNDENLCLQAGFPAASLFKIVAAAAAIEDKGFTPDKILYFRGRRYTLYRGQLRQRRDRYTNRISLRQAFSKSVNPVFGKIGIYDLGGVLMTEYATGFLFNQRIPFDVPVGRSYIDVPEDDFGLAEIASGFNKRTLISPLHAGLITAAVANDGVMMEPWLVATIRDESGRVLYQAEPNRMATPIKRSTADSLKVLMAETVISGTCRKAFRPLRRKKRFVDIAMGAKTGTINDKLDQFKYDWLTAYAIPPNKRDSISVTILAVHGEKLGIRAADLARYVIGEHFNPS
jgi:cell division protein FtsI/penicillin-binding protein 2